MYPYIIYVSTYINCKLMGLMKYQLGISGEIVSFFLEFDHAWDAGKARERERERETGKPFFSPSPITASCLPGIPGSILRAQACRHGNTPGKLNIHRSSEIERQHLTILFHSAVQSVSEKFCVRKKKSPCENPSIFLPAPGRSPR